MSTPSSVKLPMSRHPLLLILSVIQVVAAIALMAAIGLVLAGTAPTFFGAESFTVLSGSMEPAIHVGALAVVRPAKSDELKPGDVITYRVPTRPDLVVTHRLMAIEPAEGGKLQYRTKGDANNVEDLVLVDPGAVLGRVAYSVPYAGYIVAFSARSEGKLLFIGLPLVLLGVDVLRDRRRKAVAAQQAAVQATAAQIADAQRLGALMERGTAALRQGHLELAERAADAVIAADPRNVAAWVLKAQAAPDAESRMMRLQAALMVNPNAPQLAALVAEHRAAAGRGANGAVEHSAQV